MRRITTIAAVAVVVIFGAGCASNNDNDDGDRGLRDAVQAYADAYLTGDAEGSYDLLSERCHGLHEMAEWRVLVGLAGTTYGEALPFTSYEADLTGDAASVTYTFELSEIDQDREPWVYEDGGWRVDECAAEAVEPSESAEDPADDGADPVLQRVLEETGGDADAFADLLDKVVRFQAGLSVDLAGMAEAGELAGFCADVDANGVEDAAAEYEADYEEEGGEWTPAHEAQAADTITTFCEN